MKPLNTLIRILLLLTLLFTLKGQPAQASSTPPAVPVPQVTPPPDDAQSTTGPTPPAGIHLAANEEPSPGAVSAIVNVPAYLWTHGCGPTAAGMLMAYWDLHGYTRLYPSSNDSSIQNSSVNELIASSINAHSHLNDYANPQETTGSGMLQDNYLKLSYTPHADDSLADFMLTSRSSRGNQYGWGYFNDVRPALLNYALFINRHYDRAYHAVSTNYYYSYYGSALWTYYKAEIDAGRPVILLVDSSGDGGTDHFITATGYSYNSAGQPIYRFNDTWDNSQNHWAVFRFMTAGQPWGIFGMVTFRISGLDMPTAQIKHAYLPSVNK